MSSVNKAIIVGRLGKDPETRYTAGGDAVTNLRVATSEKWTGKDGNKQEKTEWHSIVLFKRVAEIAGEYLHKGEIAYFEGRLQTREWEKDGVKRYSTEIVCDRLQLLPQGGGERGGDNEDSEPATKPAASKPAARAQTSLDDDIPF